MIQGPFVVVLKGGQRYKCQDLLQFTLRQLRDAKHIFDKNGRDIRNENKRSSDPELKTDECMPCELERLREEVGKTKNKDGAELTSERVSRWPWWMKNL